MQVNQTNLFEIDYNQYDLPQSIRLQGGEVINFNYDQETKAKNKYWFTSAQYSTEWQFNHAGMISSEKFNFTTQNNLTRYFTENVRHKT
ncbi:MAG: hypothetical protein HQK52_04390 [Oligoflexia bacterium]|nr:hypothetical protein [Oligoflexia bacterium]